MLQMAHSVQEHKLSQSAGHKKIPHQKVAEQETLIGRSTASSANICGRYEGNTTLIAVGTEYWLAQ